MANSTAKQPRRIKDGSQKGKQPPVRIDEQQQGSGSSGRQYGGQQGRTSQSHAESRDNPQRDPSGQHPRQADDHEQSRQQGRNLPEGNQQTRNDGSSQQQQGYAAEKMKGQWQQHVGSAKVLWGKLTDDEILKTEGHADRLVGLVRERYAVSEEAAQAQVKKFYADTGYYP